ncbi:MAG: hypothetical protein HLUCCA04_02540 [Oceanicaulis sp. HLUCCA04]|nr:MAG: hypothetical protein HLUCCA04_02540 [Oceanicaulis sp. HLUCCA04]
MKYAITLSRAALGAAMVSLAPVAIVGLSAHAAAFVQEAPSAQEVADAIVAAVAALGPDATEADVEAAIVAAIISSGADSATASAALAIAGTNPVMQSPAAQTASQSVSGQLSSQGVAGVPGGPAGSSPTPPPPPPPGGRGGSDY